MTATNGTSNIFNNSVCLIVRKTSVGITRKIPVDHIEVDADKSRVGVNKSLLKSPEMAAIKSLDGFALRWIYSRSIANEMIASSVYIVKTTAVAEVREYLLQWRQDRETLINALCDVYPALVLQDRQALKGEFDPGDYPGVRLSDSGKLQISKDALRHEFSLDWEFKAFITPELLKQASPEIYAEAVANEQQKISSMTTEVIFGVREEAKKLISHLVDKLTPGADGKAKVLHTSSVEKVQDFLNTFESCKNLGDDKALSGLIKSLRQSMAGVTKDAIKNQEPLRESIRKEFEKANSTLDQLLTDKPKRVFTFDEVA